MQGKYILIGVFAAFLGNNILADSDYTLVHPKGLSNAWFDFVKNKRANKAYGSLYTKVGIKPTSVDNFSSVKGCLEQSKFNNCDLWMCVYWAKNNYSSLNISMMNEIFDKDCTDLQVRGLFKEKRDHLVRGREKCLEEYQRNRRIGTLSYSCEGLLDSK